VSQRNQPSSAPPPSGRLSRGTTAGVAVARVGVKKAIHLGRRPFLNTESKTAADLEFDGEAARILFEALSVMRGCALKVAQVAAMEMELLPQVMRDELAKSYCQVPPLNRALTRKVISRELGRPESLFQRFEWQPFAAASLGQVHFAVSRNGLPLAIKIQYPGAAEGVQADVALLQAALAPTRYRRIFSSCIALIRQKLTEELDYVQEAGNTTFFHTHLPEESFATPAVVNELSTSRVLATHKISGNHLDDWLKTGPSRALRNHFGQRIVDLMNYGIQHLRQFHADPNPGNFLFRSDERLGVVDFGCVERLTPEFANALAALLWEDTSAPPAATVENLHAAIGIHYRPGRNADAYNAFLDEWSRWIREPYQQEFYDFTANSEYFSRGQQFLGAFYHHLQHYDGEFLYFGRTLHGVFRILHRLGARVRLHPRG
jgi:predicted unusual protein kinase regulating ubiquinone biosynthesis (AarF/ABC1/UbiB family)